MCFAIYCFIFSSDLFSIASLVYWINLALKRIIIFGVVLGFIFAFFLCLLRFWLGELGSTEHERVIFFWGLRSVAKAAIKSNDFAEKFST